MRLGGKICAITGGGSGIGRETCLLFATEGATVVVADKSREAATAVAAEIGGACAPMEVDVASAVSVANMVREVVGRFGRLDVLVNNAGWTLKGTIDETSDEDWDRLVAVNITGVFLGCKHTIPVMRKAGGGVIVNTASVGASVGIRERAAYCATKGAVLAMTRAMALDHVGDNIRINCVAPGTIDTPIFNEIMAKAENPKEVRRELAARQAMNRLGTPREIANGMLFLACDESSFMTGAVLTIDGGWTAQ
jgi:NAD(P)-dependent dehydrogenase (short-subunit alcohol dehydrogenase family)